ncbi:MAG TPA: hypothetical protein PK649_06610 [Vicingus sp.]|nr:hypothetical protein [Vicingus sp.]
MKFLNKKIDIFYWIFAIIGFGAIAYFIDVWTALFLIVFLSGFASTTYFLMNIYVFIMNKMDIKLLTPILISLIGVLITGCLLYFYYGTYALLRTLSLSVVLFIVIIGYTYLAPRSWK